MKIHNITQLTPASAQREAAGSEQSPAAARRNTTAPSQNVRQLQQPTADSSQDIDTLHVEELRQAIAAGEFTIRADRIAEGLIASLGEQPLPEKS